MAATLKPGRTASRLAELGVELPVAQTAKVAKIRGWKRTGNLLFVSGQVPKIDGQPGYLGKAGSDFSLEECQAAARLSAIHVLAQCADALDGDLDRIEEVVKVVGFVAADPDFHDIPHVVNGASELLIDLFGEAGQHARTAIGVAVMPFNTVIEVEAVFQVK
jgi:enamine deaminase RidA (YjgF/YER057c/UK114 family)